MVQARDQRKSPIRGLRSGPNFWGHTWTTGKDTESDEFEELDENDALLKELKWDFFDESSCFVHDGLKINGSGPTRGLIATQDFNAGDKIMELTDQCLICPDDILEETPGIEFDKLINRTRLGKRVLNHSLYHMVHSAKRQ